MRSFVFRLWAHDAEDGLVPEVAVRAETRMQAAVMALQHFISLSRPFTADSYLECEPHDGEYLRVRHVVEWLQTHGNGGDTASHRHLVDRMEG